MLFFLQVFFQSSSVTKMMLRKSVQLLSAIFVCLFKGPDKISVEAFLKHFLNYHISFTVTMRLHSVKMTDRKLGHVLVSYWFFNKKETSHEML